MKRAILMAVLIVLAAGCGGGDDSCRTRLCVKANDGSGTVEVARCDRSGPDRYCTAPAVEGWSCSWANDGTDAPADDFECAGL
jgi:hypothetical protein